MFTIMGATFFKVYQTVQAVCVGLLLYVAALPFFVPYIRMLAPGFWRCTHETLYHEPCPFCGVTTYVYRFVVYGEPLPAYMAVALCVWAEELLRHAYICCRLRQNDTLTRGFVITDILCTVSAVIVTLCCFLG